MDELIERIEALEGPDREVDAAVEVESRRFAAYAAGLNDTNRAYWKSDGFGFVESQGTRYSAPAYTASLDAAMTLVPEFSEELGECVSIALWDSNGVHAAHVRATAWVRGAKRVYAATPALALCAAALRARKDKPNEQ